LIAKGSQERPKKILVAMHKLSGGTTRPLKYEDIVVEAFKMFPEEFALRGHPEYPDSSDIHKPLYGPLKRGGYVLAAQKMFRLTPRGVDLAKDLFARGGHYLDDVRNGDRMPRDLAAEIDRMLNSAAFTLFSEGIGDRILDTDFYAFVGCTVRTPANDFLGRLSVTGEAIRAARKTKHPSADAALALEKTWSFIGTKFEELIERRKAKH
jgi:hypothetical protein